MQVESEIRRIIVKVSYPNSVAEARRDAVAIDNACNFAAGFAGVEKSLDYNYFYRVYRTRVFLCFLMV